MTSSGYTEAFINGRLVIGLYGRLNINGGGDMSHAGRYTLEDANAAILNGVPKETSRI
jgi:hypothetical protein